MKKVYNKYLELIGKDKQFDLATDINVQITGEEASNLIKNQLLDDKSLMISRFGSTELNCILNYYFINRGFLGNFSNVLTGIPYFFKFKAGVIRNMNIFSGFFPLTVKNLERFSEMSLQDLSEIDTLGSWMKEEQFLFKYFNPNHKRVMIEDLSPFNHENPWSAALEGKKVLIIHPFEETIRNQYKKREQLFKNKNVLPSFDLKIIKAVQSIANTETGFKDWFEGLDFMTEQIYKTDFDIAILGCGAYGMPLAARIKRMGKKAIHIGGATQCLFGIKGKRWETNFYNYQEKFYNESWVRPAETERPKNSELVEGNTYW